MIDRGVSGSLGLCILPATLRYTLDKILCSRRSLLQNSLVISKVPYYIVIQAYFLPCSTDGEKFTYRVHNDNVDLPH